jgi:hypothetical protein
MNWPQIISNEELCSKKEKKTFAQKKKKNYILYICGVKEN